jgi:hypothetical protein
LKIKPSWKKRSAKSWARFMVPSSAWWKNLGERAGPPSGNWMVNKWLIYG